MNWTPPLSTFVRQLLRELREIKDSLEKQTAAANASNERHIQENLASQKRAVTVDFADTVESAKHEEDNRKYRQQERLITWTRLTFLALVVTVGISSYQACQMKTSTGLFRRQLKANHAGVVEIGAGVRKDAINVVLVNKGKGNAYNVSGRFRISRINLPEQSEIWVSEWHTIPIKQVQQPGEAPNNYKDIPGFDWDSYVLKKEAVRVEGTLRYSDGFDEPIEDEFCVVLWFQNEPFPCADLPAKVRFEFPREKR